ncbi:MAG: putative Ig domain-containing protein [Steroidobacteraceae bacterium]
MKSRIRVLVSLCVALGLAACGGGSGPDATTLPAGSGNPPPVVTPPPAGTDTAPTISGTPTARATIGQSFSFQPSASDADGDRLTFSISGKPSWASFDAATGHLWGTPQAADAGKSGSVVISVSDGTLSRSLPGFSLDVALDVARKLKSNYGHYFATRYSDKPADAAMLCEQNGVRGVVWRQTWNEVEPSQGNYDFSAFDRVLTAIANSGKPDCNLWLMVEFKSFANSPVKNPCPTYLQSRHSAPNADGNGAATCFMWEPAVVSAYTEMMKAAAARFDGNEHVEGLILQESSLGFNGSYSQDAGSGGTYTAVAWRDALIQIIDQCAAAFATSRCAPFLNFLRGGQQYLHDISAAISAIPDNQVCFSGPDLLPDNRTLFDGQNQVYQVLARHQGCRSNSAQNDSYGVPGCGLSCIFQFAVSGTFGYFPSANPLDGGVCVNSYLFWNHTTQTSQTGLTWKDALPVIARTPYGPGWYEQCAGSGNAPP